MIEFLLSYLWLGQVKVTVDEIDWFSHIDENSREIHWY